MPHLRYPFEEKLNMNIAQRRLQRISSLIAIVGFSFLAVAPFQSIQAATCCNCHPGGDATVNVCLTDSAATCGDILTKAKNPALAGFTCEPKPLEAANCISISKTDPSKGAASAKCVQGPTDATGYKAPDKKGASAVSTIEPIIPNPNINITGLVFSKKLTETDEIISVPFIAEYIAAVYKYAISITVIAAAIMMIYGGFLWIIGASITSITKGKKIIGDALIGLLLVYGSFTLLNMLNPKTVSLQSLQLTNVKHEIWESEEEGSGAESGTISLKGSGPISSTKHVCSTLDACKALCDGCSNASSLPPAPWIASGDQLMDIPQNQPGIIGQGSLRKPVVEALLAAGKAAQARPDGPYTIHVGSTIRSLAGQVKLVCAKICTNNPDILKTIGGAVAWPGGSNHGTGVAVDLMLFKDKKQLTYCCDVPHQTRDTKEENAKILQEIMNSTGWVRLSNELWHFEFGTNGSPNRCTNCSWPPK